MIDSRKARLLLLRSQCSFVSAETSRIRPAHAKHATRLRDTPQGPLARFSVFCSCTQACARTTTSAASITRDSMMERDQAPCAHLILVQACGPSGPFRAFVNLPAVAPPEPPTVGKGILRLRAPIRETARGEHPAGTCSHAHANSPSPVLPSLRSRPALTDVLKAFPQVGAPGPTCSNTCRKQGGCEHRKRRGGVLPDEHTGKETFS
jgi:hypothetical protein